MIFLWILGAIFLLFAFILFVGVKIHIEYKDDLTLFVSVLGIRIPLLPKRKKKISPRKFSYKRHRKRLIRESRKAAEKERKRILKENQKKLKAANVKNGKKKLPPEQKKNDEPTVVSVLLSVIVDLLDRFFGTLGVEIVRLRITVGGPDAATTAITYGAAAQGVSYLLELLAHKTVFRRKKADSVSVTADFLFKKTTADVSLVFTFRVWNLLRVAFVFLSKFIKEKIRRASVQT
ncbi:MAG: hypothetical protein IJZ08_02590 [Clostridia bacterium]|nr:hypothetical protein [Clostridia bacterium]